MEETKVPEEKTTDLSGASHNKEKKKCLQSTTRKTED
jgi:hypothetical protein